MERVLRAGKKGRETERSKETHTHTYRERWPSSQLCKVKELADSLKAVRFHEKSRGSHLQREGRCTRNPPRDLSSSRAILSRYYCLAGETAKIRTINAFIASRSIARPGSRMSLIYRDIGEQMSYLTHRSSCPTLFLFLVNPSQTRADSHFFSRLCIRTQSEPLRESPRSHSRMIHECKAADKPSPRKIGPFENRRPARGA